jgi:hypothetical protein
MFDHPKVFFLKPNFLRFSKDLLKDIRPKQTYRGPWQAFQANLTTP